MITSLTIKNFKRIGKETYNFTDFDLLVGRNNSGKSTILQALAIWQFCIEEFRRNRKAARSKRGIQIVLPNFTPLPLPEFVLLWHKQTERRNIKKEDGTSKPDYILIEIEVAWLTKKNEPKQFTVAIRYQAKQSLFAIPQGGWANFNTLDDDEAFPNIMYVPPYSGLEDDEEWKPTTVIKKYVGKFQAGSVLRNILLRVYSEKGDSTQRSENDTKNWEELTSLIRKLFSVELMNPSYRPDTDTQIHSDMRLFKRKREDSLLVGDLSSLKARFRLLEFSF